MKILFVDYNISEGLYKNILKDIAEENEIKFFSHPMFLLDYFTKEVIPNQIHIDAIISDVIFPSETFKDTVDFFRLSDQTYSYGNFKLSAIPIIVHTVYHDSFDVITLDVDKILPKPLDQGSNTFSKDILNVVKDWRKKIYNDLEILGIGLDYNFLKSDIGYAVRIKNEKAKILSKTFILKQERLPYQWLKKDFFEMEFAIEELETLVNHYLELPRETLTRKRWEDQLQEFFKRNPKFLFEDNYGKYWSQPKLDIPQTKKSYKPDFIVKPEIAFELGKNWDVIDLKLPIQDFLQQTQFHQTFTSKFFKCLKQIVDYKQYFLDNKNKDNIEKVLGFHPKHPKLTLVLGRRNVLFEHQDKIYKELDTFNMANIYLLTYDEIIESQKRNLQRLLDSKIR